jgi:serine/threonine protein kinase
MKVYCTRPCTYDQTEPHSTELAEEALLDKEKNRQDATLCATCGMPLILNGRYVPIKKLGQGGFGYTFLALDLKFGLDSKRVIKQFRSDLLLSAGQMALAKKAFEREYKIQDQLKHPQIPRVYEPFDIEAPAQGNTNPTVYYYFVQEYIEGEDLQKKLKNRQQSNSTFSEVEVQDILKQVLEVLHYIHNFSPPIIHRDVKPSNIIQTVDGRCYLVDFGAVKQVLPVSDPSRQTTILGTPGYAPPEQFDGTVDFSSDLYALAKTCICLLTGSSSSSPPWGVSELLTNILNKMINLDPQMRYRSAGEVQDALGETDHLPGDSKGRNIPHPNTFWLLVILVAILVAIGSITYFQQNKIVPLEPVPFKPDIKPSILDISPPSRKATYGGSTTWKPLSEIINPAIERHHEPFKLELIPDGKHVSSEEGIEMLIKGILDFSLSSKEITPNKMNLRRTTVARTRKVMVVHPDLKIDYITSSEANKIYTGEIRKWSELRHNLPSLTIKYYQTSEEYISSQRLSKKLYTIRNDKDILFKEMSEERGSAIITPVNLAVSECSVKTVPIIQDGKDKVSAYSHEDCKKGSRKVNIKYINQDDSNQDDSWKQNLSIFFRDDDKQNIGKSYVKMLCTMEGQALIEKAGYLPSSKIDRIKKTKYEC